MGNAASAIDTSNVPAPENQELLNFLLSQGFQRSADQKNLKAAANWVLRNTSTSTYSDHVSLELINPQGLIVATIRGKNTSYDYYMRVTDVRSEKQSVDLSTGKVVDGFFMDAAALKQQAIKDYKSLCRSYQGYPEKQGECDAAYSVLEQPHAVQRIVLHDNPIQGGLQAMASLHAGLD